MADKSQVDALSSMMNPPQNQALVTPGGSSTQGKTSSLDSFMDTVRNQLTQQSGIVSSSDKTIQDQITAAISSIQGGAKDSAAAIEKTYNAKEAYQATQNANTLSATQEAQRGFATNTALLQQIKDAGSKSINDLEQQKQSLILSGNAQAAQKIADLQVQEATMMVQNRQNVFNNLVALAGVGTQQQNVEISRQQLGIQQQQADRDLQSKMGSIALQYGVKVQAGDDISSVVNRAAGNAKALYDYQVQDAALGLKLKGAQIALAHAQAAKAGEGTRVVDYQNFFASIKSLGGTQSATGQQMVSGMIASIAKDPSQLSAFTQALSAANKPQDYSHPDLVQGALFAKSQGQTLEQYIGAVRLNSSISNKDEAEKVAKNVFGDTYKPNYAALYAQAFITNPVYMGPAAYPIAQAMGTDVNYPFGINANAVKSAAPVVNTIRNTVF